MKENLINRMRSSSFMKLAHMAIYVFLILYASAGIYDICAGEQFYLIEFIKYIGVDVLYLFRWNWFSTRKAWGKRRRIIWDAFITES